MKIFVVTWTNHVVGQVGQENIKCFEQFETARAFAKMMSKDYSYVNMFEDEVTEWDS